MAINSVGGELTAWIMQRKSDVMTAKESERMRVTHGRRGLEQRSRQFSEIKPVGGEGTHDLWCAEGAINEYTERSAREKEEFTSCRAQRERNVRTV
jgi:hypothetical protein